MPTLANLPSHFFPTVLYPAWSSALMIHLLISLQAAMVTFICPNRRICPVVAIATCWMYVCVFFSPEADQWLLLDKASLVAQIVNNLPAMQETWVWSMGWEDTLEKGMTTHSSSRSWRIPWTEEPGGLQTAELQRVKHDWVTNSFQVRQYVCTVKYIYI